MATYCSSLSNQRDVLLPSLQDQKLVSNPESLHISSNAMYLNQSSTPSSSGELLSGSFLSPFNCVEITSLGGRNKLIFTPQTDSPMSMQAVSGQINVTTGLPVDHCVTDYHRIISRTHLDILDGEQDLQHRGLSLSLATQIPSADHAPLFHCDYTKNGPSLSSHVPNSEEDDSLKKESRHAEYLTMDLPGVAYNVIEVGATRTSKCSVSPKDMHYGPHLYEGLALTSTFFDSKYLKTAQQLLDEVVNVGGALKQHKSDKHCNSHKLFDGSKENDVKSNSCSVLPLTNGMYSDQHELTTNSSCEISSTEWQDLQAKVTKLLSLLDEVVRRYRHYYHQMQIVVSSFEMIAGCGAAKRYTSLALQTISRHFRCLRDAINNQIRVTKQGLMVQDATQNGQGGGLSRLRCVDQQLKQQKALQQLGVMQHSWRPQRGLPESSVLVLRAWMFEHFLHPYPKDSEKIMLARQTGLSRSQVANWFINARVRLWKPMVEEMYKEEFGKLGADTRSSPERAPEVALEKSWACDDDGGDLQETVTSMVTGGGHLGLFNDLNAGLTPDLKTYACNARLGFQNGAHQHGGIDLGVQGYQGPNVEDHSLSSDDGIPPTATDNGSLKVWWFCK